MNESNNLRKNASYINKLNKIEVLQLIRESVEISRAGIVRKTKLSAPTITRIIDSLINDKLVLMAGEGDSTGGRPPKLIRFDGTHNYVIGIDLGSTSIRGVISNIDGKFLTEIETPTDLKGGFEKVNLQVVDLIHKLIDRSKFTEDKIMGIGLAVAGLINSQTGIVEYSPMFNWKNVNLRKELKKHLNIPVFYDNVSRVTALGELLHGVGKKYRNFICINAGYGIGAGIIINGALFYGNKGFTGEFGHVIVDHKSPYKDKDGINGCLEALSSGYGMAEIAKLRLKEGATSSISEMVDGELDKITAEVIMNAAKNGDAFAMNIIDEAMIYLGLGVDSLIKLFNPEIIVFSGGLTKAGDMFFEKLKEHTFKNKLHHVKYEVQLVPSSFQEDATLIGAFSLIISKVLQFEKDSLT
ncbi:MAG: ROK family protein [Bacteroidetes bacterium]|nr:ROK family protein [Bacteroidota bacterium]